MMVDIEFTSYLELKTNILGKIKQQRFYYLHSQQVVLPYSRVYNLYESNKLINFEDICNLRDTTSIFHLTVFLGLIGVTINKIVPRCKLFTEL